MKSSFFTQFDCAMAHTDAALMLLSSPRHRVVAPAAYAVARRMQLEVTNTMLGFITRRDQRLMRHLNRWSAPRWVRVWMLAATRAGDGWLWWTMGVVILLFGGPERFRAIATGVLAAGAGILLFRRIKKATNRKRPCTYEPH